MTRASTRCCVIALACALLACGLLGAVAWADALDDGVQRVARQLECPVCAGETVADSPSGLAGDMRAVIRTKLQAGEGDQQILSDFVASYGDSILAEPPKQGVGLGVWLGPVAALAGGAVLLLLLARRWTGRTSGVNPPLLADPRVMDELRELRQEIGP